MSVGVDLVKLARLCEMFRSDNEQERATAARMATALLHAAGFSWTDLVRGARRAQPETHGEPASSKRRPAPQTRRAKSWGELTAARTISRLVVLRRHLSAWDRAFVEILEAQDPEGGLTERQWVVIEAMVKNLKSQRVWVATNR